MDKSVPKLVKSFFSSHFDTTLVNNSITAVPACLEQLFGNFSRILSSGENGHRILAVIRFYEPHEKLRYLKIRWKLFSNTCGTPLRVWSLNHEDRGCLEYRSTMSPYTLFFLALYPRHEFFFFFATSLSYFPKPLFCHVFPTFVMNLYVGGWDEVSQTLVLVFSSFKLDSLVWFHGNLPDRTVHRV